MDTLSTVQRFANETPSLDVTVESNSSTSSPQITPFSTLRDSLPPESPGQPGSVPDISQSPAQRLDIGPSASMPHHVPEPLRCYYPPQPPTGIPPFPEYYPFALSGMSPFVPYYQGPPASSYYPSPPASSYYPSPPASPYYPSPPASPYYQGPPASPYYPGPPVSAYYQSSPASPSYYQAPGPGVPSPLQHLHYHYYYPPPAVGPSRLDPSTEAARRARHKLDQLSPPFENVRLEEARAQRTSPVFVPTFSSSRSFSDAILSMEPPESARSSEELFPKNVMTLVRGAKGHLGPLDVFEYVKRNAKYCLFSPRMREYFVTALTYLW